MLSDDEKRAAYDAAVSKAAARAGTAEQGGSADTVDLEDMQWDGMSSSFFQECRCGGRYALMESSMPACGPVLVPCNG